MVGWGWGPAVNGNWPTSSISRLTSLFLIDLSPALGSPLGTQVGRPWASGQKKRRCLSAALLPAAASQQSHACAPPDAHLVGPRSRCKDSAPLLQLVSA